MFPTENAKIENNLVNILSFAIGKNLLQCGG
jgi:hypothetical protein